ncbi:MAG: hypothetical protein ACRDOJ_03105 [Nocardioidaceae bacterium]
MGLDRTFFGRRRESTLMPLRDALDALGNDGVMGDRTDEVPLASVVGSMTRAQDFDQDFGLVNRSLRGRWDRLATAVVSGAGLPPVDLVQLGELYFVKDGHHRVSVARSLGMHSIPARVRRICTIAYAMCCLRLVHLPSKAAERAFLERVPVPDDARREMWLDEPSEWMRLADAAEAWAFRRSGSPSSADRFDLARAWWEDEVMPVLNRVRRAGVGLGTRDVQLYVTALAVRDRLGRGSWPDDLADHVARHAGGRRVPRQLSQLSG